MKFRDTEIKLIYKEYENYTSNEIENKLSASEAMQIIEELNKNIPSKKEKYKSPFNINITEILNKRNISKITTLLCIIEIGHSPYIYNNNNSIKNNNSTSKYFWHEISKKNQTKILFNEIPPFTLKKIWLKIKKINNISIIVQLLINNEQYINQCPLK